MSTKIKIIPSKSIIKLTDNQLETKSLKLELNPLIEPPADVLYYERHLNLKNGCLKAIKEYFYESNKKIQINKGEQKKRENTSQNLNIIKLN